MSQPLIIVFVIAVYFMLLLLVARFASRGADNSTFFSGNRKMPWPLVSVAMICAPISGVTFISVPGMVLTKGFSYLQMCLGFIVGYLVIAWVLIPIFYRNSVTSIYSYLGDRFGSSTYKTGAWMFLISKVLGTSVKFLVICTVLQLLVFAPVGIPFPVTVVVTLLLVWLYTFAGGVKAVIWTDMLKCACLIISVVACIYFVSGALGYSWSDLGGVISSHESFKVFNFDEPMESTYFWKEFIAGIFMVVAMTGLDQDMMQHALTCRNARSSKKNMVVSSVMQFIVIALFLSLGTLLAIYMETYSIAMPQKSDDLFATVAFDAGLPLAVGVLFILGLVSATYSSIGSALTSLTTSYTIDVLGAQNKYTDEQLGRKRKRIHASFALIMASVIIMFYYLSHQDAISAVFTLASYTYGPILGLFVFGLFTRKRVNAKWIPAVCILSPVIALGIQWWLRNAFDYHTGFELLLINAALTIAGLTILAYATKPESDVDSPQMILDN